MQRDNQKEATRWLLQAEHDLSDAFLARSVDTPGGQKTSFLSLIRSRK